MNQAVEIGCWCLGYSPHPLEEPLIHPAVLPIESLLVECEIRNSRRSGPGGQHRNKVETAVIVCHLPSGLTGQASERRSQAENREIAIQRLRLNLAVHVRSDKKTQKSDSCVDENQWTWTTRIVKGRISVSEQHEQFPAVLATLLDDLAAAEWDVSTVAGRVATSGSQIIKLLRKHAPALGLLNSERAKRGLSPLS